MKEVKVGEKKISFFRNKKLLTILMGFFIISIMIFSVLYYGLDSTGKKKVEYHGLRFVETNQGWQAYTEDGQKIFILSNPEELEDVSFAPVSLSFLGTVQKVYISFNPYDDVSDALQDFQQNIPFSVPLVGACYEDNDFCAELPLNTCADASLSVAVVLFREANETSVTLENNCLTLQGKNLLILTDKLILDSYVGS